MKTLISALAVVAALGLAVAPAMAQQTTSASGTAVDGMGSGGNIQNRYVFDGPAASTVTSTAPSIATRRTSRARRKPSSSKLAHGFWNLAGPASVGPAAFCAIVACAVSCDPCC
jgi:hypothetical protein